ncbi:uncharacterized protein DS421_3g84440 [Arachis hypogaea]|nr:uncharacterized protein DS421_3g84440 [Arachis hypogaea]
MTTAPPKRVPCEVAVLCNSTACPRPSHDRSPDETTTSVSSLSKMTSSLHHAQHPSSALSRPLLRESIVVKGQQRTPSPLIAANTFEGRPGKTHREVVAEGTTAARRMVENEVRTDDMMREVSSC